jgi:kynurenine formamidase
MASYDCTQPVETGMPVHPGDDPVAVTETGTVPADGSRVHRMVAVDARGNVPLRARASGARGTTLDEFDVSAFAFDARVVDFSDGDGSPVRAVAWTDGSGPPPQDAR